MPCALGQTVPSSTPLLLQTTAVELLAESGQARKLYSTHHLSHTKSVREVMLRVAGFVGREAAIEPGDVLARQR